MRRVQLLFWALALTLIPHHIQAADSRDYKEAEKLALQERYEEAVALMLPLPDDTSALVYHRLQALQGLLYHHNSKWTGFQASSQTEGKGGKEELVHGSDVWRFLTVELSRPGGRRPEGSA